MYGTYPMPSGRSYFCFVIIWPQLAEGDVGGKVRLEMQREMHWSESLHAFPAKHLIKVPL